MKNFVIAIIALIAMTGTAFAQTVPADTNADGCVTKDETKAYISVLATDVTVASEGDTYIEFTSPDKATNLVVLFDENGCVASTAEVQKKAE